MSLSLETALERIEALGRISDSPDHLVRTFLSPANLRAARKVAGWMEELGMRISQAVDGTVRGILPGTAPDAAPLLIGSHIDTVTEAGRYDGALGVIAGLAALESLREKSVELPFPVHLLAFSDEEGTRFQTTYLGSKSTFGELDATTLSQTDAAGISVSEAIQNEGWHEGAERISYENGSTLGYVELHIEQGRVLEEADVAVCAVSGIAGQSRFSVRLVGKADHAGTTPMRFRRDALTGAAECILEVEKIARENKALVATVGKLEVLPGASNSIPQSASFSIDLRHPDDTERLRHQSDLEASCRKTAAGRSLEIVWKLVQENDAVPCDPALTGQMLDAVRAVAGTDRLLASGAGHDGVVISKAMPIAMLFVRCREGLSHHPDEFASDQDIGTGIQVLAEFLTNFRK